MSEWKPGDVAMVCRADDASHQTAHRAFLTEEDGWVCASAGAACAFPAIRPLVVIDPEDAEHTERMWRLFACVNTRSDLTTALREFARPTPSIEEPTGLGAVVEDAEGKRWVLAEPHFVGDDREKPWHHGMGLRAHWQRVKAVRILSPGVEATS